MVRISVVPSFARLWLMRRLPDLQGSPPQCRIELLVEHRIADLPAGQCDLAIRYGNGRWRGGDSRLLFTEQLFPVAAPVIVAELGVRPGPARIAEAPLLHDSDTGQWRAWLRENGIGFRAKPADRRFEDYDLVLAAAQAGLGIALLRSPLANEAIASGYLVRVARPAIRNVSSHHLVMTPGESRPWVLQLADQLLAMAGGLRRLNPLGNR